MTQEKEITEKDFAAIVMGEFQTGDKFTLGNDPETMKIVIELAQQYAKQEQAKALMGAWKKLPTDEQIEELYPLRNSSGKYLDVNAGRREAARDMHSKASKVIVGRDAEIERLKLQNKIFEESLRQNSESLFETLDDNEKKDKEMSGKDKEIKDLNEEMEQRTKRASDMIYEKDTQLKEMRKDVIGFAEWMDKMPYTLNGNEWEYIKMFEEIKCLENLSTEQLYSKYKSDNK